MVDLREVQEARSEARLAQQHEREHDPEEDRERADRPPAALSWIVLSDQLAALFVDHEHQP